MKTRLSKVLACLFAGILTATAADYSVFAAQTSTLEYYVCPNSKMLKEDETDYSECQKGGTLRFSAAANERESGQIILSGYGNYTINSMSLDGLLTCKETGKQIPSQIEIKQLDGTIEKVDTFEIFFEHYVDETGDTSITDSGSYPDALIPDKLAEEIGVNTFTLGGEKKNQGVWFTVTVPPGTPAGIYNSNIILKSNGLELPGIPVEVTVFDFELPDKTKSVEWLGVHASSTCEDSIKSATGIGIDSDNANILYLDKMNSFLDKRKVTSGHSGVVYDWLSGKKLESYIDGIYNFVSNNKAPYYDIMVDTVTNIEAPIKLESKDGFFQTLKEGLETFREYDEPKIVLPTRAKTLEDLESYEWPRLNKHIEDTAKALMSDLKELAKEYLGEGNVGVLSSEDEKLLDCMKHFYAKFLIIYQNIESPQFTDKEERKNVRVLLCSTLLECGRYQHEITLPYYHYLFTPMTVILSSTIDHEQGGLIGVTNIMRKIVDKSMKTNLDLLQYAFLKVPNIDEPPAWSLTANLETLLNAATFENCKTDVEQYINDKKPKTSEEIQTKESLLKSLNNLMMLFTTAPTNKNKAYIYKMGREDTVYTAIQYNGLKYLWDNIDENSGSLMMPRMNNTSKVYNVTDEIGNNIELPVDFYNKGYCTLFTDFSSNESLVHPQDYDTTRDALDKSDILMWWYSCTSTRSAGIAGFRLNQNRGLIDSKTEITMDPLAVKRVNKWQQFQMGIIGEHFWAVDDAFGHTDPNNPNRNVSQWGKIGNENLLVYPIKQYLVNVKGVDESTASAQAKEYGYFMSTLRLENEAEANDDYDYLCLAKQLADLYPKHPEYIEELDSIIQMLIEPGNVDYTKPELTNASNLEIARIQLAKLIENISVKMKEVTPTSNNRLTAADGVPLVENWHKSNKYLCFDVYKTDTYQKPNNSQTAKVGLMTTEGLALSEPMTIDFNKKQLTINDNTTSPLIDRGNGWYTVQIPMGKTIPNTSAGRIVNEDETFGYLHFSSDYVNCSFLVDDFRIVKEVTPTANNHFTAKNDRVPVVTNWHKSNKCLCFDVMKTDTYSEGDTAAVGLMTDNGLALSEPMTIDFNQNKLIINDTTTSPLIDRGNGWYTVQIPMDKTDINQSANRPDVSPTETFGYLLFHGGYVQRSFLVDNIKIVKEVTPEANNHFTAKNDGVPVVTNWHQSNKCLCFDVYKTDTYPKKNNSQTAKVGLMTINGLALSEPMTIDFNQKKLIINDTLTPSLIDKGNGWYTVQIPMDKTIINQSANRPDVSPTETFGYLYFSSGGVNCSFLVDNFKIESAKGNGDLNGDGKTDKTDVDNFMAYLARNAAPPQNAWEADLDHNGVHDARDMSRLKQMLLA